MGLPAPAGSGRMDFQPAEKFGPFRRTVLVDERLKLGLAPFPHDRFLNWRDAKGPHIPTYRRGAENRKGSGERAPREFTKPCVAFGRSRSHFGVPLISSPSIGCVLLTEPFRRRQKSPCREIDVGRVGDRPTSEMRRAWHTARSTSRAVRCIQRRKRVYRYP